METVPLLLPELDEFAGARCVVTGGLGFIGSNVARVLAAAGARVVVVDALVPEHGGDRRNLDDDRIEVVIADIGDAAAVTPVLRGAEVVFNVAGQVSHLRSMVDPVRDLELNVHSQLRFLELIRDVCPTAAVTHTSTRQVYGRTRYLPVDEDHPTVPTDVNGIDKLAAEQLHLLYATVHDLRVSALRLTNVYGPRQSLVKDDLGFFPVFLRQGLQGETITVYGDGQQLRDCVHVADVVRALVAAVTNVDAVGEVFNIGHPQAHALVDIARLVVQTAGAGGDVTLVPWPHAHKRIDIGSFRADYSKAKRVLSWEPQIGLPAGVADTIAFYKERPWYLSST